MNKRKNVVAALAFLAAGLLFALSGAEHSFQPARFVAMRALGSLKLKVADNFSIGCWSAQYRGTAYFPNRFRFDPYLYQGYDIVPGFTADIGKIIGNTKLSLGWEYYYLWRNWEYDGEPSIKQSRFRGNVIFSTPFKVPPIGNFNMTVTQRFERILHQRWVRTSDSTGQVFSGSWNRSGPAISFFRLRSTFKLSAPAFTNLKISPYAYYEGFNFLEDPLFAIDPYYYELEIGFSISPAKGLSFSLADQIQSTPNQRVGWEVHQISFYLFYTLDFSKQIADMTKNLKK